MFERPHFRYAVRNLDVELLALLDRRKVDFGLGRLLRGLSWNEVSSGNEVNSEQKISCLTFCPEA